MEKEIILTAGADPTKMTFSPAVKIGNKVYPSGSAGINKDGSLPGLDIESQARQAFANIQEALEAAGSSLAKVVKVNCYLTHPKRDIAGWNKVYKETFPVDPPARTTIGCTLLNDDWCLEIEVVAYA